MTGEKLLKVLVGMSPEELALEVKFSSGFYPYEHPVEEVEVSQAEDTDRHYHVDDKGKRIIPAPTFIWLA